MTPTKNDALQKMAHLAKKKPKARLPYLPSTELNAFKKGNS